VETFREPKLIQKHLTDSDVPNWESSARRSGDKPRMAA
jgi:hypothetical protein